MKVVELTSADVEKCESFLKSAISETFENLIFTEPEFEEETQPRSGEFLYIDMLTPLRARLLGKISSNLSAEIASTVLGIEPEHLSDVILNDAVGEVLNTIAGHFLRSLLPDGDKFDLGLPGRMDSSEPFSEELVHISAKINDEPISICLAWSQHAAFTEGEDDVVDELKK